jgi:glycosyltransferase involved in cell wall biosynthesis
VTREGCASSSPRVALVHNLSPGGAWRTMYEHQLRLQGEIIEFCLHTATPVTVSPNVVRFARRAESVRPALRPLPRHLDLLSLVGAWRRLARAVNLAECDVVLAHPCRYLQSPLALRWIDAPSVYFCHEPRRVDYEQAAAASVNQRTRHLYGGLRRAERQLDRIGVFAADSLLTNSRFTAGRIQRAYGRTAEPVSLGVPELFREPGPQGERAHLLSVGSLIPSKGHDLAIAAAALTAGRWPLIVVAPRFRSEEAARLQNLARRSSVALDIRIGITDLELRELYRGAICTLYLAREEPFGLASLEAQACGSPVVVADDGGLPETMLSGETGWTVRREDAGAAAQAIDALQDPELMSAFSARAHEHGCAQTWGRSAARVQDILERACRR